VRPSLSVIIPTRDRPDILKRSLSLLLEQAAAEDNLAEVLIVDDGSGDAARAELRQFLAKESRGEQVRILYQVSRGPAAARNLGVEAATTEIVLFLGDDILPCPGLLSAHVDAHCRRHPDEHTAILGQADLAPELCGSAFVHWWRRYNFRYQALLSGKRRPGPTSFYTNNLSLKRRFLLKYGLFDEAFPDAAYEDIELGYRLSQHGLQVIFVPQAQAYHYHPMDLRSACQRMETRGRYYDLFRQRTPLPVVPRTWRWLGNGPWIHPAIIRPLWRLAEICQARLDLGPIYISVLMYCFLVGRGMRPPLLHGNMVTFSGERQ
jgi:glycosyltransferase involved in cell wall biosynthesis